MRRLAALVPLLLGCCAPSMPPSGGEEHFVAHRQHPTATERRQAEEEIGRLDGAIDRARRAFDKEPAAE